jgi:hypothetical protein
MLSRRSMLVSCAACFMGSTPSGSQVSADRFSCILFNQTPNDAASSDDPRFPTPQRLTFSENFENSLIIVISQMVELFEVDVLFGTYDDSSSPNARSAPTGTLLAKLDGSTPKDGFVMFGRKYLVLMREMPNWTTAITTVCAHEFGHILQFKFDFAREELINFITNDGTAIRSELHADFVCGYYGAIRKRKQPAYPAEIQALTEFNFGDARGAVLVHGTSEQRGDAVNAGFELGNDGNLYIPREVVAKGLEYVRNLSL